MKAFAAAICAAALLSSGCAQSMYRWGDYDAKLFNYYQHPDQSAKYTDTLNDIIVDCNNHSAKVPPGIYAEYGYCQYQKKDLATAVKYFELEKSTYPESAALMDRMIVNVKDLQDGGKQ